MRLADWGALLPVTGGPPAAERDPLRAVRVAAVLLLVMAAVLFTFSGMDDDGAAPRARLPGRLPGWRGGAAGEAAARGGGRAVVAAVPAVKSGRGEVVAYAPPRGAASAARREALVGVDDGVGATAGGWPRDAYLTACVMVKDAADVLPEFVARNHLAGVDHFVLMDDSEAGVFEYLHHVLEPVSDIVTLVRVSRDDSTLTRSRGWSAASQINALLDCAESLKGHTTWVAFVDVDEFFEANEGWWDGAYGLDARPDTRFMHHFLREVERNDSRPAVCVKWKSVLTNGRVEPAPCGVLLSDHFPHACNVTGKDGHPLVRRKTVVRLEFLDTHNTPRDDSYGHTGFTLRDPFRHFRCSAEPAPDEVSILHYWSMSVADYVRKIARGRPRRSLEQRTMFDLLWREQMCEHPVVDPSAAARGEAVKLEIARLGYRCAAVPETERQWTAADEVRLEDFLAKERPAMQLLIRELNSGRHFNSSLYADAFQLSYKSRFGGFLAAMDLVPWIHYYLHGYDPETAERWFSHK